MTRRRLCRKFFKIISRFRCVSEQPFFCLANGSSQDIIAILGMDELSEEDKLTVSLCSSKRPPLTAALSRSNGPVRFRYLLYNCTVVIYLYSHSSFSVLCLNPLPSPRSSPVMRASWSPLRTLSAHSRKSCPVSTTCFPNLPFTWYIAYICVRTI